MKRILSLIILGTSSMAFAQLQVNTLNLTTNDLVYDSVTNKIYASIPSANGSNGNSIGVINPNTYLLENTIFIGSEPTILAISDNGQYIYSGFSGSSTVRRFDVASQTAGLQFSLGSDSSTGSYYAEDIEVMPSQPTTIAISRKNNGFSPRHEGVVIYDNNVMRPTTTPDHTGSNRIEFTSQNSLIGYNNETTEFGIRRLSVNSSGVSNVSVTQNVLSNFYLDFIYKDNYMYSFDGKVVDVTTAPFVIGQFSNATGPVVYDSYYNRVCFGSYDFSGNITFKRFNPNTFLLYDSLPISQAFGSVKNIITCGNGCYAFNTTDNKVIIIKDSTLGLSESEEKNNISIYPNPTTDYLFLKSGFDIKDVQISDLNGRIINNLEFQDNKMNLTSLQTGIYFAKISDINGKILTKKIIKK
ncbi:T9SS type A sorting domain-containing protein [Psychroflexus salinarum]|uniref:T9SS type A sorting domain-containing protein n=1 Tax=Psychroflexus salinarum TaxID=546024 RepID=A0ABW3GUL0_9FLAO